MQLAPRPHLNIPQWLNILELEQYGAVFQHLQGVEDLLSFSEADIKDLGVKNSAHRARIVSSLVALRTKYDKSKIILSCYVVHLGDSQIPASVA
uniref:SAM domain-containing protein n=1 Tax=Timema douglasi TaxID=61478 RepID=A0A7R8W0E1_TIMDO|nr:unnamed protein product [Timema douglasi]